MPGIKSFKALCPFTKLTVAQAYDQETSNVAAESGRWGKLVY